MGRFSGTVRSCERYAAASPEMILEAKRDNRSAKLHFSVQDMFRLPYADKSFDVVIVSSALHIVPQSEKALQEIKRVLKPGGTFLICNESNGDTDKDEKRTEIIGGMIIYKDIELKAYLGQAGYRRNK